jgi:hypothetical protein
MFRSSSRQPIQVVAPPVHMSSQPIYIPAPKASSSAHNQPYTILVGSNGSRHAPIEIVVNQRPHDHVQPITSQQQQRRHSVSQYHHQPSSSSYEQPKIIISTSSKHHRSNSSSSAPRSDMATYGGSVYGETRSSSSSSKQQQQAHGSSHDRHRDDHHYRDDRHHSSSHDKRDASSSNRHVSAAAPTPGHTRHRTISASGDYLRPPTQPVKIPSSSPQKHARFAPLPQSVPTKPVALPVVSSSAPIQVASSYPTSMTNPRPHGHHRSSQSHDLTLYATRPRQPPHGWFNRRGDQYFVERGGVVRKADASTKWNPIFNDYPEPGTGWMDHEKRFIPAGGGILKH